MRADQGNSRTGRLEARISIQQKRLFQRAADLQGGTLTEFVVSTLQAAATRVIQDHEMMTLTEKDREIFCLCAAVAFHPKGRLKKAVTRYEN